MAYRVETLRELALSMLEDLSTVKGWKQRGSVPIDHCVRASLHTRCSLDWLILGVGEMQRTTIGGEQVASGSLAEDGGVYGETLRFRSAGRDLSFVLVPRYAVRASAGPGQDNGSSIEHEIGEIAFEATWMRSHFGRAGTGFALLDVAGNSMEPTLWDGETILVDLQLREVVSGSVYVLRDGDELLVKRLQRMLGGAVEVVSDNANFRSQEVQDPTQLSVIGRVVWPKVR